MTDPYDPGAGARRSELREINQRLARLEAAVARLLQDSHPPQPVVNGAEFDEYKRQIDRRLGQIEARLDTATRSTRRGW